MNPLSGRRPGLPGRRLPVLAVLAVLWCAAALAGAVPSSAATGVLANPTWTVSASTTGSPATYTYAFTTGTSSSLNSVTMTLPTGTTGSPAVGAVSPASVKMGGGAALSSPSGVLTLTYSFTAATVAPGTAVSIQVTGLTSTGTAGSYTSVINTQNGGTAVDSGTTASVTLTVRTVASPAWSASSTTVGMAGVTYTYTFSLAPALLTAVTSVTMTVPPGTTGTPVLGTVSPGGLGGTIVLSGTTLTYSFLSLSLLGTTNFTIPVRGLTNTATAGSYTSEIVATGLLGILVPVPASVSGITAPAVTLTGPLSLVSPSSLGWAATLNGAGQSAVDGTGAHQQFTVDDETATGNGWHLSVTATTFTTGTRTLANGGTLVVTGSRGSVTATSSPTVACMVSCVPPVDLTVYPVAISTAASAPAAFTIFSAQAGSGQGPALIGGSAPANPVGWWVNIPAGARAGAYTSTITIAIVSGPS